MLSRSSASVPVALVLAATVAMGIMLLGGCPQQQVPDSTTPDSNEANTTTTDDTDQGEQDRPIPPVVVDDSNDTGTPDDGGDNTDDGNDAGSGDTGTFSVRISAPLTALAVRPGTTVDLVYKLTDRESVVNKSEFVVARDSDQDGEADGDPVAVQVVTLTTGSGSITYDTNAAVGLLSNGLGHFLLGLRLTSTFGEVSTKYASGTVTVDAVAPSATWMSPTDDHLISPRTWPVSITTSDNSAHTVRILLDNDTNPGNGYAGFLVTDTTFAAGTNVRHDFTPTLAVSAGTYYYYVVVSDGVEPPTAFYAPNLTHVGSLAKVSVTNRLIGDIDLNELEDSSAGAILRGHNFNDLAGSTLASVPDLDGDGKDELLVGARFGKPNLASFQGQGWGEAYMIYGGSSRLHGTKYLNATGTTIPGVLFRGIRTVLNTNWSEGLSDISVIPDMDGDNLPELAFSFPRVESVSLSHSAPPYQDPLLKPDLGGMGALEMNAVTTDGWNFDWAQFTRGGIVLVSSHNNLLVNRGMMTRKFDRVLDLHEVGQLFTGMERVYVDSYIRDILDVTPSPAPCENCVSDIYDPETECPDSGDPPTYCDPADPTNPACPCDCTEGCDTCGGIEDNPDETEYRVIEVYWDTWNGPADGDPYEQGAGGFHMPWTVPPADPPLCRPTAFVGALPDDESPCVRGCMITNYWVSWPYIARTSLADNPAWDVSGASVWTGYYGNLNGGGVPLAYLRSNRYIPPTSVGARVLGQELDDRFGTAVSCDGTWLYISAPDHTARPDDVPALTAERTGSGAVYMMRVNQRGTDGVNTAQLWVEPGQHWPNPDAEQMDRLDYTLPTPHQYIIETVGSWRMDYFYDTYSVADDCITASSTVSAWDDAYYSPYPTGTAGYNVDRTPEIIGPDQGTEAHLSYVRALGDLNADGVADFGVGSPNIEDPDTGDVVGGIYIVYGRPVGLEGHVLLEDLHRDPSDAARLAGVMLKGVNAIAPLARVFDDAGDFNGDGIDDVIVGAEAGPGGDGEVIIVLGNENLESPAGGWTVSSIVGEGHAIRFVGMNSEQLGANVAGLGDVDGDGYTDVLIAAPGADGGRGVAYLIYGSADLSGDIVVSEKIGTVELPGARFLGRNAADELGGGSKSYEYTTNTGKSFTAFSRGVMALGDLDGDGYRDFAISAMLADPDSRADAGEVYVIYGSGD